MGFPTVGVDSLNLLSALGTVFNPALLICSAMIRLFVPIITCNLLAMFNIDILGKPALFERKWIRPGSQGEGRWGRDWEELRLGKL